MTRTERVAVSLLRPINPSVIIILGLYTVVWGLWIVNPFWAVFAQAPVFSAMMGYASEVVWGCIAIGAGLLIMRGALKPSYRNLQLGALVGCLHWLTIGILFFMGDWMNTGGISAIAFALYSAVVWVNIKVNRGQYK
jgi:hypothetical protein